MTPFKPWEDVPAVEHVALLLPFEPNWSEPIVERLGWKMGAHASQAGVEHRRNLRREPRQAIEFSTLVTGADVPLLRNVVEAWGAKTFAVPLWYGMTTLEFDVLAGDVEAITVDSLETLAQVGGWVILWSGTRDFEVAQVTSVGTDFVGFLDPLTAPRPAGTRIVPLQFMQLQATQSLPSPTPTVVTVAWVFEQVPGYAPTLERYEPVDWDEVFPTGAPANDPRNHFLSFPHNWSSQPDVSVSIQADTFDPGTGVMSRRVSTDRTSPQWSLDVLLDDRAKTAQLRRFLSAHRGPAISFWAASPLRDLGLAEDIAGAALVLENNGQHLAPPVLRMGVHITHVGGEVRESVSAISGTSATLRNDPGPIALADVWRQSWVSRCRLAIETVSISHLTNRVAQVRLPVIAVDVGSASAGSGGDVPTSGTVAGGGGAGTGPVLLLAHFDAGLVDSSPYARTLVPNASDEPPGATPTSAQTKFGAQSLAHGEFGTAPGITLVGDFAVDFWVRGGTGPSGLAFFGVASSPAAIVLDYSGSGAVGVMSVGGAADVAFLPATDTWAWVVVQRAGTTLTVHVDGGLQLTLATTSADLVDVAFGPTTVRDTGTGVPYVNTTYIDEVRVYSGSAVFGSGTLTVPTVPYT